MVNFYTWKQNFFFRMILQHITECDILWSNSHSCCLCMVVGTTCLTTLVAQPCVHNILSFIWLTLWFSLLASTWKICKALQIETCNAAPTCKDIYRILPSHIFLFVQLPGIVDSYINAIPFLSSYCYFIIRNILVQSIYSTHISIIHFHCTWLLFFLKYLLQPN